MSIIDDIITQFNPIATIFEKLFDSGYIWVLIVLLALGVIILLLLLPFL